MRGIELGKKLRVTFFDKNQGRFRITTRGGRSIEAVKTQLDGDYTLIAKLMSTPHLMAAQQSSFHNVEQGAAVGKSLIHAHTKIGKQS